MSSGQTLRLLVRKMKCFWWYFDCNYTSNNLLCLYKHFRTNTKKKRCV